MNNNNLGNKYVDNRNNLFKVFLCTIYISFVSLLLSQMQSIIDFNYTLHEMLYLPINIAFFIVPIELSMIIYYSIRYSSQIKKVKKIKSLSSSLRNLVIVLSVVFIFSYTYYIFNIMSTSGIFTDFSKTSEKNKYFLVINDKKIRCTQNEFNLISPDKTYLLSFDWNRLTQNKGKLIYIKLTE